MTGTVAGAGSWRELFGRRYRGATIVLAGGVGIYAINEFITMSMLPSVIADIGGARLYSWVTTVYLVASVIGATTVGSVLTRFGPRRAYLGALLSFAAGTAVCMLAPSMPVLLLGRTVQGFAGGVLAGLGYAVISAVLPERLWPRAAATVSAMWGLGTLIGPASGGLFAQLGSWRGGFGLLLVLAAAVCVLVPLALPDGRDSVTAAVRIPVVSLALLGLAALIVSVAAVQTDPAATGVLLVLAVSLVVAFVAVDRTATATVLPRAAFRPGPLKWIYLTLGLLMAATMVDMYVPLFGQRLVGLSPVIAGFMGAALSVGWTIGEICSASVSHRPTAARLVTFAPLVMAVGLGLAAVTQRDGAGPVAVAVWALALVITGAGIGSAWPHLSVWAMGSVSQESGGEPTEQAVASAAVNTVQLICGAFGAGLAGVMVNLRETPDGASARSVFALFAALAAAGVLVSRRAARPAA